MSSTVLAAYINDQLPYFSYGLIICIFAGAWGSETVGQAAGQAIGKAMYYGTHVDVGVVSELIIDSAAEKILYNLYNVQCVRNYFNHKTDTLTYHPRILPLPGLTRLSNGRSGERDLHIRGCGFLPRPRALCI
jgi:hypothetical protein